MAEGILAGGSCGTRRPRRARGRARDRRPRGDGRRDPARRRARLPVEDLQRRVDDASTASSSAPSDQTVGDVLRASGEAGEIPPLVTVQTHQKVRDAIALLHEHRVSQLPVVSAARRRGRSSARSASAGCCARRRRPGAARRRDRRRDGAAVPGRLRRRPGARGGRAAERRPPGADRHRATGRPVGHRHARRPARGAGRDERTGRSPPASCTRASSRTRLRLGHPGDPPDLDLRAARAGRVRRGLRLRALGEPDAPALEDGARRARGRPRRRRSPPAWPPSTR